MSAPLLLRNFCHGLLSFDLLNNGNGRKDPKVTRLKGVLEPGVRVTLITTACYSGGWVTNQSFRDNRGAGNIQHLGNFA